jgi:alcohol dehydrogenase
MGDRTPEETRQEAQELKPVTRAARDDFMKGTVTPNLAVGGGRGTAAGPLPAFDFQSLGRVVYEPGALARLGEMVRSVGGSRVLLVTDPGLEHAGHPQRAEAAMR